MRGDGTRVYFFDKQEIENIWGTFRAEEEEINERGAEAGPNIQVENTEPTSELEAGKSGEQDDPILSEETASETRTGFDMLDLGVDRRLLVNRQRKLKMYRCWLQGRFRKRGPRPMPEYNRAAQEQAPSEPSASSIREDGDTEDNV